MVLLIDNYDSFTYNLYDYILQLGYTCTVVRNDKISIAEIDEIPQLKSIVISPGPGKPQDAGISMKIIETFHQRTPILGICLGHQAIGCFFGSRLVKAQKPMHGKVSKLNFKAHFLFYGISSSFNVMRYHSLILENLSSELKSIAQSDSGEIMAIAHSKFPLLGIQFHPESILTENGLLLLDNFFKHYH